jgi:Kef-type K+ transport system membrane component KefB
MRSKPQCIVSFRHNNTIAVVTKVVGCELPSTSFLKDKTTALRVGIRMVSLVSREEVGLIEAEVGISAGVLFSDIDTAVISMIALTTIITPIWLKKSYMKDGEFNALATIINIKKRE